MSDCKTFSDFVTIVGERFYRIRKKKGYSLLDVSLITGVTPTTISNLEKGFYSAGGGRARCTTNPKLKTIVALCECYKVDFFEVFDGIELPKITEFDDED